MSYLSELPDSRIISLCEGYPTLRLSCLSRLPDSQIISLYLGYPTYPGVTCHFPPHEHSHQWSWLSCNLTFAAISWTPRTQPPCSSAGLTGPTNVNMRQLLLFPNTCYSQPAQTLHIISFSTFPSYSRGSCLCATIFPFYFFSLQPEWLV
jgi:hypothetical protein